MNPRLGFTPFHRHDNKGTALDRITPCLVDFIPLSPDFRAAERTLGTGARFHCKCFPCPAIE
jgi:hypothetical protein